MKNILHFISSLTKRYFIDYFFLAFPQFIGILAALIALPIILANLPIKDYGGFQFVLALQFWIVTLTAGHITLGAKRGIAKGLEGTFLFAFFFRLKFIVVVGLISFIASFFIYKSGLIILSQLIFVISIFLLVGYLPRISYPEFFIAKKQFKNFAIWQTATSLLIPTLSAIVALLTHNILLFAIVHFGLISLIGWLGFLYVIWKNNLFSAYKENKIDKECVPYGIKLIPSSLILETANRMTNFVIGPFFGFANLAVFSVAYKLEETFRGFMRASYNLFYSDFARKEQDKLIKQVKSKLKQGLIASIILSLGFVSLAYIYIALFLPVLYQTTKIYFLILSFGLPAIILHVIMHTILAVNFRYKELTTLIILQNLIKIVLIILLGLLFGIIGICWAIALGTWINFGLYYLLTIKRDVAIGIINKYPWLIKLAKKY
ncbi:oligosaccharide flippase family protein [Patescibacteria group bacterium AH-259-L07]|nr:oligosaccharide flippase family protein [Patescibacteria group bacterium AH-259-L07]